MRFSQRVARLLATWFGCGYFPWGPGTVGAAAALAISVLTFRFLGLPPWSLAAASLITFPISTWACGVEAVTSGRKDPGHVVLDEVVGQWITLAPALTPDTRSVLVAFALFRVLDITKPFPVRQLESLPGGVGIMADDVMAGIYGAVVMLVLRSVNF